MKKIFFLFLLIATSLIAEGQDYGEYDDEEVDYEYVLSNNYLMVNMGVEMDFTTIECVGCYPEYHIAGGINYYYKLNKKLAVGGSAYWNLRKFYQEKFFLNLSENTFDEITPLLKYNFDSYAIAPTVYYFKSHEKITAYGRLMAGLHLSYKRDVGFSYVLSDTTFLYQEKSMSVYRERPGFGFFGKGTIGLMYGEPFSPKIGVSLSLTYQTGSISAVYREQTNIMETPTQINYIDKFTRTIGSVEVFVVFPMVIGQEKYSPEGN